MGVNAGSAGRIRGGVSGGFITSCITQNKINRQVIIIRMVSIAFSHGIGNFILPAADFRKSG